MGFTRWLRGGTLDLVESHETANFTSLADLIISDRLNNGSIAQSASLSVAAVFRARQLLADNLGALPLDPPQPAPNDDQPWQEFVVESVLSLEDSGDFYWHKVGGELKVLPWQRVTAHWSDASPIMNRHRVYKLDDQILRDRGTVPNLFVGSMNRGTNDLKGLGWMESGRIKSIIAIDDYATQYYRNNGQPSGVLKVPGALTEDEAKLLKAQWDKAHAVRSTAVISTAMDYTPTSFNATDSQWVEAHLTSIGDVANLSGVPAFLLAYSPPGSTQDYQNVETVLIRLWRETLFPTYAKRIQDTLTEALGSIVMFDPSQMFVSSMVNRSQSASVLVGAGYDPADVAAAVGLPPLSTSTIEVPDATR